MSRHARYHIPVDQETNESLDFLKSELHSPKTWIVSRLVMQELARVKRVKVAGSGRKAIKELAAR
jgi:hypothetical protein